MPEYTTTTRLALRRPVGGQPHWGTHLNVDIDALDAGAAWLSVANTFTAKCTFDTVGGNGNGTTFVGAEAGGAVLNFKPTHADGYTQFQWFPEQGAQPDVILTVHKNLSGTSTAHQHLSLYASPSIGAAPTGRFDLWYGQNPTVAMWSGTFMAFNTDSYWNLDVSDLSWWTSGSINPDFDVRGNATGQNRGITLTNTATNGHKWRLAELAGVGLLSFKDLTASGQPFVLTLDGTNQRIGIGSNASGPSVTLQLDPAALVLSAGLSDAARAGVYMLPRYDGAFTVTRHNYLTIDSPALTNGAAVTDAAVFRFTAAAGTHKAVDAGTTKATPGGVDAWIKHNLNGTIYYSPLFASKTA